ncbi:response regulator [Terricaulis sp.]|uniref:response regulator n=1 Tax=Terricaulis sp. TaxID=2768686 RepID=UPI002AC3ABCE|nr:response regulator [Terricaulis sp.]MDZ4689715.1 response regulator [Terricaulis sp.]
MAARAKVCLVDDDIFVRDALALGLNDAGFDVVTAPGAAAGFDIVQRGGIDAIVTDMNMPGTDGAQFISEARGRWPDIPIVAISGAVTIDGQETAAIATSLGANATLMKPFRARQLAEVLGRFLPPLSSQP